MKKEYSKPTMLVVELRHRCSILSGSQTRVTAVKGNVFSSIQSDASLYDGEEDEVR